MTIEFTPKQAEAMAALQSERYNLILYGGAIRGGKSVWGLSALLVLCSIFPKSRWCVIREDLEKIRTTTIPSFKKLEPSGRLRQNPFEYTHPNGSVILFKGESFDRDKDLDWMKGLEVNGFLFEEINECQQQTLFKAFERAGAWIIPNGGRNPKPIILATCNPSFGWVKELIYDKWKTGQLSPRWLYTPAKITDNPHLPEEYKENLSNLPRYEYEVFVNGNWDIQLKTGGEFYRAFELDKHIKYLKFDPSNLVHVSIDSNVLPYIAISIFQLVKVGEKWKIKLIHEIPAKDPDNTAKRAAYLLAKWLRLNKYELQKIYLYGDRSTKSRNNIDDDKRSFAQIFTETVIKQGFGVVDKFATLAPSVAALGDFVNAVFDNSLPWGEIEINDACKTAISDYIETKTDRDGTILKKRTTDPKTGASYEPHGHYCDNLKDFMFQAFPDKFKEFQNRFKMPTNGVKQISRVQKITY